MAEELIIHPGPYNPSLLNKQSVHVSEYIWNGKTRVLRARRARDSRSDKLITTVPKQIVPLLQSAGFYHIACVKDVSPNHELITALVERWRPETHTFHLPVGECTITLQDVALQLGLRIDGRSVTGVTTHDDWRALAHELLGKTPSEGDMKGSRLKMSWLNENFANVQDFVQDMTSLTHYTRAYILRLFGGVMFPDSSGSLVSLRYLPLLRNFCETRAYSWGSAVLAHLYKSLCSATNFDKKELTGCNLLVQLWAFDRIRGIGLNGVLDTVPNQPLGARWKKKMTYESFPLQWYRRKLDTLRESEFVWQPYPEHLLNLLPPQCVQDRALWKAVVPLLCFHVNEYHHPDRVMRQFGEEQHVPDPPRQDDRLHDISLRGKIDKDWGYEMRQYIRLWEERQRHVYPNQPVFQRQTGPSDKYMMWYNQHTRRWMTHDVAALVTMTEKLHYLWYMLRPERRAMYDIELVYQEIGRCLAIIGELNRILSPSHDAPPPMMALPQLNRDEFPNLGKKEGEGIQRGRESLTAKVLTVERVGDPPPGRYHVPPQHLGAGYTSYDIPFGQSSGTSGYQDFAQPTSTQDFVQPTSTQDFVQLTSTHHADPIGLQDYGVQSTPSIFEMEDFVSQQQQTVPSQQTFDQGMFYTPDFPIGQMQTTPGAPVRQGGRLDSYHDWATVSGANLFAGFGEGSSSHTQTATEVDLNMTLASGGDNNPVRETARRYDTRQSRQYQ